MTWNPCVASARDLVAASRVLVIAHRGDSRNAPENTLPAFESAAALGADFVELDYLASADGVSVVFHDEFLDRTTDACSRWADRQIPLASKTFAQLRELDAGSWFAPHFAGTRLSSLEQVLAAIAPRACLMIERKSGDAASCVALLRSLGAIDRVTVHAFDWHFLRDCHELCPELLLGALGDKQPNDLVLDAARALGASLVGWEAARLDEPAIAAIHARGLKAWAWTVDEPAEARRLLAAGVDGLISNVPGVMQRLVAER
ncbi:MAG TPA: glycerophosphodiester phosphodiesterase [Pirellulales bacterium]